MVVVIGAVDVVGAGIVVAMTDTVVVEVAAGSAQATTKTNRTRPRVGLDAAASAHYKAEKKSTNGGPNQREVVTDGVNRRRSGDAKNRGCGYTADHAHEDGAKEVFRTSHEASNEPTDGSNAANNQH